MSFLRGKAEIDSVSGADLATASRAALQINDSDTAETISNKIEIFEKVSLLDRQDKRFADRRAAFRLIFNSTFVATAISAIWSLYVMFTSSQQGPIAIAYAQFILSTVVSAGIASGVALMATQPEA